MTAPVVATDTDAIVSVATTILRCVQEVYADAGVPLPKRQVIVVGGLPVDDEVLGVIFGAAVLGPPGNEPNTPLRGDSPRTAHFSIELWRKSPTMDSSGRPPSASAVTDRAQIIMQDVWLLLEAAIRVDPQVGVIVSAGGSEPQGAMIGANCSIEVQIW